MKTALIGAALLAAGMAPAADGSTLEDRLVAGRIGAGIAFVVVVSGLALGARALARRAKEAEDAAQLEAAFREIDDDLDEACAERRRRRPAGKTANKEKKERT